MGGNLRLVTNSSWKESTLAYAKSPAVSIVLSFSGVVRDGDVVEFDLGAAIKGERHVQLRADELLARQDLLRQQ